MLLILNLVYLSSNVGMATGVPRSLTSSELTSTPFEDAIFVSLRSLLLSRFFEEAASTAAVLNWRGVNLLFDETWECFDGLSEGFSGWYAVARFSS